VYDQWRALADLGKLYSVWQDTGQIVRLADMVHPEVVDALGVGGSDSDRKFRPGAYPTKQDFPKFTHICKIVSQICVFFYKFVKMKYYQIFLTLV
jgi:hypothetical protein